MQWVSPGSIVLSVIAMAVVGADEEGGGESTSCRLELPAGMPDLRVLLATEVDACDHEYRGILHRELVAAANDATTEDFRRAVRLSCARAEPFTQCLAKVKADAGACLAGLQQDELLLDAELKASEFEVVCLEEGRRFATIREEQRKSHDPNFQGPYDIFSRCELEAPSVVAFTLNMKQDPNHGMKYKYRLLRQARECLEGYRGKGQDVLVDAGTAHWADLMDRMKCLDPDKKTHVFCKTLVSNSTNSTEEN